MSQMFVVNVNKPFSNLFHDIHARILGQFTDKFWEIAIRTVLKYDYQVHLLLVKEVLSCLQDVGVV